jgi:hypothetical protein
MAPPLNVCRSFGWNRNPRVYGACRGEERRITGNNCFRFLVCVLNAASRGPQEWERNQVEARYKPSPDRTRYYNVLSAL